MKHQYESEILFHLMERDGFNIPSSVPPYEAEIKAYLINQVKLAYPKLTDYEAEWLLYNYTKHLPADFPISSATNVTEATFENVVPFAYQSAILKGQTIGNTLPNLSTLKGEITLTPSSAQFSDSLLKKTTIYTLSFNCSSVPSTGTIEVRQVVGGNAVKMENISVVRGYNKFKITSSSSGAERIRFKNDSTSTSDFVFNNLMIIEGDYTNVDIPYFTDMQSVKSPVLTITGKNLFDGELEIGGLSNVNGLPVDNQPDRCRSINYTKVNSSTGYVISGSHSGIVGIREFDEDCKFITWSTLPKENTFTTSNKTEYLKFIIINKNIDNLVQLEEGTTATPYEPYKTNILTVNGDVTLRSNGSVYDELDLLTGKLTQRIDEDGSVLTQEVVKTVDLKTVNESGESVHFMPLEGTMHVQSSGDPIQPTFDMSVPVEATTQNLASFIDLEMEE